MFAHISFPISSFKTFIYKIPNLLKNKIKYGSCVNASINKSLQVGFVVQISNKTDFKGKILNIDSIRENELHIPKELWDTLKWISKYYITPFGQVLKAAIPNSFMNPYEPPKIKFVQITSLGYKTLNCFNKNKPTQKKILDTLALMDEPIKVKSLLNIASSPYKICSILENQNLVEFFLKDKITDPFEIMGAGIQKKIKLSNSQKVVVETIKSYGNKFNPCLIHGVTGSGKTEVYLKLAQLTVNSGKSVIVLVPEISLTPQVASRFRKAFGSSVALWHSKMTKAEKGWTWIQLKKGNYNVVVGARSAVFTPIKNLGLIIVDEEQESSYKQENPNPKYNARDVAMIRGKYSKSTVILTSATPSLESYYNAQINKFNLLKLNKRFGGSVYPQVKLVDMKKEYKKEQNSILSNVLINAINDRLKKSEQIIILQNRRGYSRIQQCLDCGKINLCDHCSISLTYHFEDNKLHCHYCHFIKELQHICKYCNSKNIIFTGSGTQRVEKKLLEIFNNIKILRMDIDTVSKRGSHQKILQKFANKKANILLGTQMIAKGLDFDNVTLVGIINADSGLFFPDFRAGEKVFQLIYQVAGRAGRRQKQGLAIVQTYNPDDIYIKTASNLDIHKFYNIELAQRQELNYPPFSRLCRILFIGKNKNMVNNIANKISNLLNQNIDYDILGPVTSPIEKIKDNWRMHLIIKTKNHKINNIHQYIFHKIGFSIFERKWNGVRIQIDIDPISML